MFNKKVFKELLEKAIGNRTMTEYSNESGVNRTYISKYINEKLDNPPTPDIIKRLANTAQNGVTYEDFMKAAGHLDFNEELNIPQEYTDKYNVTKRDLKQREDVLEHAQSFMMDDKVSEKDKEKLFEIVNKLYWKAKSNNKEKYGKNKGDK